MSARWNLFCKVVDNFGDIGVCWRLARMLVAEHSIQVTLWVDDLVSLARLCSDCLPERSSQVVRGVEVVAWADPFPAIELGDAVVEAFGCGLPASLMDAMAKASRPPVWINLEHLSAERWITGCHGLPSPHPSLPITTWFYYPGFVTGSGGLLREAALLERRDAFLANPAARRAELEACGIGRVPADVLTLSLFCYPSNPVAQLLEALAGGPQPVLCLMPEGVASAQLRDWLGIEPLAGSSVDRGNLKLRVVPFRDQDAYDRLLWACDWNFVRGEDSFVRAQWAGKPFVWGIYPQPDRAHDAKLEAFLDLYSAGLTPAGAGAALAGFWRLWNAGSCEAGELSRGWYAMLSQRDAVQAHALDWSRRQRTRPDLATELVSFRGSRV